MIYFRKACNKFCELRENFIRMKKIFFNYRSFLAFSHDTFAIGLAFYLAFVLRFNFDIPNNQILTFNSLKWMIILIFSSSFLIFKIYRGVWRYSGLVELKRIFLSVFFALIVTLSFLLISNKIILIPHSILIIFPLIVIFIIGGNRFLYRIFKENITFGKNFKLGKPVIILSLGEFRISTVIKELLLSNQWNIVSILSDDPNIINREICGIKVHGSFDLLSEIKDRFNVCDAILIASTANYEKRNYLLNLANDANIKLKIIPDIDQILQHSLPLPKVREFKVEDLLSRNPVNLDNEGLKGSIKGSKVLVTGAGGSIGSELCEQILKYKPFMLICVDISEYALYQLEIKLKAQIKNICMICLLGDIKDVNRIETILLKYKPSFVFHSAAYKHVSMTENYNVAEVLKNNVLGTYYLALACQKAKVRKFVLISSDKAVNPTNLMGASKRLAEIICQSFSKSITKFIIVRFGNVLGSSGSVIPLFREQIISGGPVTVTHPKVTRYFMLINEAVQLVLQATLISKGNEIFLLEMGEPVKILDLAKSMIKLSGFQRNEIKIKFIKLKPGEKLFEELLCNDEISLPTSHDKLKIIKTRVFSQKYSAEIIAWVKSLNNQDENSIKKKLKFWLKEYTPQ